MLTGRENLVMFGRLYGLNKSAARTRAKELLDEFDLAMRRDRRVKNLLGRNAPADRHRLRSGGPAAGGLPGRADHRAGSAQQAEHLGPGWQFKGRRHRHAADHAVPRGGRRAERPDHRDRPGRIIAEGTAEELKERTGGTYCEIVPRDLKDLAAIADTLGSLVPEKIRAAMTPESDRIAMPAPEGASTLIEAVRPAGGGQHRTGRHRAAAPVARRRIPGAHRRIPASRAIPLRPRPPGDRDNHRRAPTRRRSHNGGCSPAASSRRPCATASSSRRSPPRWFSRPASTSRCTRSWEPPPRPVQQLRAIPDAADRPAGHHVRRRCRQRFGRRRMRCRASIDASDRCR